VRHLAGIEHVLGAHHANLLAQFSKLAIELRALGPAKFSAVAPLPLAAHRPCIPGRTQKK